MAALAVLLLLLLTDRSGGFQQRADFRRRRRRRAVGPAAASPSASPGPADGGPGVPPARVGIIGAGSIALGTASLLGSRGHAPVVYSPSGGGTRERQADGGGLSVRSAGAIEGRFEVGVARSPGDLVRSSGDVLLLALPANGHKRMMEQFAPAISERLEGLRDGARFEVMISSHASLGAVYLMETVRSKLLETHPEEACNNLLGRMRISAWGTTAVTARRTAGDAVNVLTVREAVDFCTVPCTEGTAEDDAASCSALLTRLFGDRFRFRDGGLLAISLSNLNPQNHLGIVLGNMSRMDPAPRPPPVEVGGELRSFPESEPEPWWQGKSITPAVGNLMEALDGERIDIAAALGLELRTIHEHFSWSFHVPMTTPVEGDSAMTRPTTVSEMSQIMHFLGRDVLGPSSLDTRYVSEDVPYGLVLTVLLGQLVGKPAKLHESGIAILSAMYGLDFMNQNDLLLDLGLMDGRYVLEDFQRMAYSGSFSSEKQHETLERPKARETANR